MEWEKPSDELTELLAKAADSFALVERRKMFGCPALFLNGHMFAGVYGKGIIVRLGQEERAAAQAQAGARPFEPVQGRVMREYVQLPEPVSKDPDTLEHWLLRSLEFVGALPPKQPKLRKPRSATAS